MRLIDANALKESIEKYRTVHLSHRRLSAIRREAEEVINDIRFAIDVASTIDPVRRGRWDKDSIAFYWRCSECGAIVKSNLWDVFLDPFSSHRNLNYCPNCGADMRGE